MDGAEERLVTADVMRGVTRFLLRNDLLPVPEVPLRNGRRVDLMATGAKGEIVVVEIKVSRADLLGDTKWTDYLDYCDRFYWAVPQGFDLALLDRPSMQPERSGLIVADRYDGALIREAAEFPLNAARRKVETHRLARCSARRYLSAMGFEAGEG